METPVDHDPSPGDLGAVDEQPPERSAGLVPTDL
jgi:hypothetical protein